MVRKPTVKPTDYFVVSSRVRIVDKVPEEVPEVNDGVAPGNGNKSPRGVADNEHLPSGRVIRNLILTAALPALGYAIVYFHEWGYLSAFDIPPIFMTIDLMTVLQVAVALVGATLVLLMIGNFVSMSWPAGRAITRRGFQILRDTLIIVLGIVLGLCWPERIHIGLGTLSTGLFFAFIDFVWPAIIGPRNMKYKEKLERADTIDDKTKTIFDRIRSVAGCWLFLLLLAAFILPCFAYLRGLYTADRRCEFLVFEASDTRRAIVLREYHDRLLCAYVEPDDSRIELSFFLLPVPTGSPIEFSWAKIGPLSAKLEQRRGHGPDDTCGDDL